MTSLESALQLLLGAAEDCFWMAVGVTVVLFAFTLAFALVRKWP